MSPSDWDVGGGIIQQFNISIFHELDSPIALRASEWLASSRGLKVLYGVLRRCVFQVRQGGGGCRGPVHVSPLAVRPLVNALTGRRTIAAMICMVVWVFCELLVDLGCFQRCT